MQKGIVVGTDLAQEWLLPWWWEHYAKWNTYPVAFFDFGMSQNAKTFCQNFGTVHALSFNPLFVKDKDEIDLRVAQNWENQWGENVWSTRHAWFKKPFACINSPFEQTVWVDLDCEVRGPLSKLFDLGNFAIAKDQIRHSYNSGVMAFNKNDPVIREWAKQTLEQNALFASDQDLLTWIIETQKLAIYELHQKYNWNIGFRDNGEAIICHWLGAIAKQVLRNQIVLNEL